MSRSALCVATLMICAACGGSSESGDYQLVKAQHADCQQPGADVAHYLDTGEPTSYDPNWGTQRQQVLGLSGDSRALYIRQQADAVIQACDANEAAQEAAAAQAQREAEAAAARAAKAQADAAAKAAWEAKVGATCQSVGGAWSGGVCRIDYRSPGDGQVYHYQVGFDSNGDVTPLGAKNAAECLNYNGVKGYWHPDTAICSI